MDLRVDSEYYENSLDFYKNKVDEIEEKIEEFKLICENLFDEITFGAQIDTILTGKATAFVGKAMLPLKDILDELKNAYKGFEDEIEVNDTLS